MRAAGHQLTMAELWAGSGDPDFEKPCYVLYSAVSLSMCQQQYLRKQDNCCPQTWYLIQSPLKSKLYKVVWSTTHAYINAS